MVCSTSVMFKGFVNQAAAPPRMNRILAPSVPDKMAKGAVDGRATCER